MPKALDIIGKRFGRLLVLSRAEVPNARNVIWLCKCDCGNTTTGAASNLGKTKFSCGCFKSESAAKTLETNRFAKPGLHGKSDTTEWRIWSRMKDRCTNPNAPKYHRYGGRGIKVCDRWLNSFEDFLEDVGSRPSRRYTLDRIDNDGNYEPDNCRWATAKIQGRNTSTNHWITIDNIRLCLTDWCIKLNIPLWEPHEMVRSRNGRPAKFNSIEDAIEHLYRLNQKKPKYRKRYNKKSWTVPEPYSK